MARRKRRYRKYKRYYRKKGRKGGKKATVYKGAPTGIIFPDRFKAKMVYERQVAFYSTSLGVFNLWKFVSGMTEPDLTTTAGIQPFYFDQMMALYKIYLVKGVKMTVEVSNNTTHSYDVALNVSNVSVPYTAFAQMRAVPYTTIRTLGSRDGGKGQITLKRYQSLAKQFAQRVDQDDLFEGTIISNPTNQLYFNIGVTPLKQGNVDMPTDVRLRIRMVFYAAFRDRTVVAPS